jgi:alpha-N-arabinofuranosidase
MRQAGKMMHGLSLHYYTVTHEWKQKGKATVFTEEEFHQCIKKALKVEGIVDSHSKIMDRYDPERKVGMIFDEWGTWHDVEPGTNPGFLYQQNTMRDALVAGLTLNVFNKHSARVQMANIAQTINVLQAVILTEGERMVLTPTYHVFDLYKGHQDAVLLDSYIDSDFVHESASVDKDGNILITLCNLSLNKTADVECEMAGFEGRRLSEVSGRILVNKPNAYNDFDTPEVVKIEPFEGFKVSERGFTAKIPPCSVAAITLYE